MIARPQLAAVLDALVSSGPADGAVPPSFWIDTPGVRTSALASAEGVVVVTPWGTSRYGWITTDPAEAYERLQTRDLIPMDYRGRFVCGECDGDGFIVPEKFDWTATMGRDVSFEPCVFCGGSGAISLPPSLPALIAWASLGFAARDDGSPGILAAEEMARASQPCPFAWKVATEPRWWSTVNTPNAARLRASGLSWWAQEGHVVIAAPPL